MTSHESLTLGGCAPTPLSSYLKAIGVLRLISRGANRVGGHAADPKARGWWEYERFHLSTCLNHETLCRFFLEEYAPSPIIAPWNGRAGFLEGETGDDSRRTGARLMNEIEKSESRRLENMRRTIEYLRANEDILNYNRLRVKIKTVETELKNVSGEEEKKKKEEKKELTKRVENSKKFLLQNLRSTTDVEHLFYIDTCYALARDQTPAPLLGSGGVDGSRELGVNYAEKLRNLFDFNTGVPTDQGREEITAALFDVSGRLVRRESMGQYNPGQGGPNATTGYEGKNPQNSWELVLAMEGAVVFSGAVTRRWGARIGNLAAFPFTFEPFIGGAGNLAVEDRNKPRAEIWTPLWKKPATLREISAIFSEGRLTLDRRPARSGLDAARAVMRIGLSRGIERFERYSIYQPDSKMPYQATSVGQVHAPSRPRKDLIEDLDADSWLTRARNLTANKKKSPARARMMMRRMEDALFQMTQINQASEGARNALMALGEFGYWMPTNPGIRKELEPPPPLSSEWIRMADDGSPEFRVAAALAALGVPPTGQRGSDEADATTGNETDEASRRGVGARIAPPMAAHFFPIDESGFLRSQTRRMRRDWSHDEAPPTVVWGAGDLVAKMLAVLERRIVENAIRTLADKPFAGAFPALPGDISAFLSGDFDDRRCGALLAGMVWVRPHSGALKTRANRSASAVLAPFAYAALKPLFAPDGALRRIGALPQTARLPIPSGLLAQLRAGGRARDGRATNSAVVAALTRARASGLLSPFVSSGADGHIGAGVRADRLAAALLVPIDDRALKELAERAWPNVFSEGSTESAKDASNAA